MASAEYQRQWRKKNPDKVKKNNETYRQNNPGVVAENKVRWARNNPEKVKASYRKYKYDLTQEQFDFMFKSQDGKCAICFEDFGDKIPQIDHNHSTGKVRQLLCKFCNVVLGFIEDPIKLESAMQYLEKHKE